MKAQRAANRRAEIGDARFDRFGVSEQGFRQDEGEAAAAVAQIEFARPGVCGVGERRSDLQAVDEEFDGEAFMRAPDVECVSRGRTPAGR